MSSNPEPRPTAETLVELDRIGGRSRWAASRALTGIPLLAWGIAWSVGFALLDLAPWRVAVPVGLALSAGAVLTTWLFRSREVSNGWETQTRAGWLALMLCSPFLLGSIGPVPSYAQMIFLGALWGVALVLYAVPTGDLPLGLVGAGILLMGVVARNLGAHRLLVFGCVAGLAMVALGATRARGAR